MDSSEEVNQLFPNNRMKRRLSKKTILFIIFIVIIVLVLTVTLILYFKKDDVSLIDSFIFQDCVIKNTHFHICKKG